MNSLKLLSQKIPKVPFVQGKRRVGYDLKKYNKSLHELQQYINYVNRYYEHKHKVPMYPMPFQPKHLFWEYTGAFDSVEWDKVHCLKNPIWIQPPTDKRNVSRNATQGRCTIKRRHLPRGWHNFHYNNRINDKLKNEVSLCNNNKILSIY